MIQAAYDYIYTQKDIGLESELSEFDILFGYPPQALDKLDITMKELFGDSKRELLIIKERSTN